MTLLLAAGARCTRARQGIESRASLAAVHAPVHASASSPAAEEDRAGTRARALEADGRADDAGASGDSGVGALGDERASERANTQTAESGVLQREQPAERDGADPRCPGDMAYVAGSYCTEASQECLEWSDDGRPRCLRFREPSSCAGRRRAMAFCIDRFEWPNRRGERPVVMVSWNEAAAQCRARGRRLCTQDEWTFACEGEAMLPYPYGYQREEGACVVDHFARAPVRALLHSTRPGVAEAEVERVYEALPSGSAPRCRSVFGVYDLVGSVDEWTVNESGVPFQSALKGGWWGRIRGRCRPATLAHNERFRYYQIGFRCCDDAERAPSLSTTQSGVAP